MAEYTREDLIKIIQKDFSENPYAFDTGRRNDDAVDLCIICHCAGIDVRDVIDSMSTEHDWTKVRYDLTMEHIERVEPYLESWGTPGTMEAMVYAINY